MPAPRAPVKQAALYVKTGLKCQRSSFGTHPYRPIWDTKFIAKEKTIRMHGKRGSTNMQSETISCEFLLVSLRSLRVCRRSVCIQVSYSNARQGIRNPPTLWHIRRTICRGAICHLTKSTEDNQLVEVSEKLREQKSVFKAYYPLANLGYVALRIARRSIVRPREQS